MTAKDGRSKQVQGLVSVGLMLIGCAYWWIYVKPGTSRLPDQHGTKHPAPELDHGTVGRYKVDVAPPEQQPEILILLDPNAPPETYKYLASIAEGKTYLAAGNKSLTQIGPQVLGDKKTAKHLLLAGNSKLLADLREQGKDEHSRLAKGVAVNVPDITGDAGTREVLLAPGSSLRDLAETHYGFEGERTLNKIESANPSLSAATSLHAFTAIKLPDAPMLRVLKLKKGLDPSIVRNEAASYQGVLASAVNEPGFLEHPVTITRGALTSTHSRYDLGSLDEQWFNKMVGLDKINAKDLILPDRSITSAIVDSGLDLSHPAFKKNVWENPEPSVSDQDFFKNDQHGFNFVDRTKQPVDTLENSHGTHVAGIASARVLGLWLPQAFDPSTLDGHIKLMILKVAGDTEEVDFLRALPAMRYAVDHGASVVSGSWTTFNDNQLLTTLMSAQHTLFVMAAGNGRKSAVNGAVVEQGVDVIKGHIYPPAYGSLLKNMIIVDALAPDGQRAYFSNYSSDPQSAQILAPGVQIKSTIRGGGYGFLSGTSQATPFVTLAASLIVAKCDQLPANSVRQRILNTAEYVQPSDVGTPGRLNLLKAISVDQDLIQVKDTIIRGNVRNQAIKFAGPNEKCEQAETRILDEKKVQRVIVGAEGKRSVLILQDGTREEGTLCTQTFEYTGEAGKSGAKQSSEIQDIIWHDRRCRMRQF